MVLCRLCYLQINGEFYKNIFDEELDPPIWTMVYELTSLTLLKTDPYTKFVCFDCYNELLKFYIFRKAVLENNQKFQQNNQQDKIATNEICNNDIKDDPHIKMFKQNNQQDKIVTNENCNNNNTDEVHIKMEIEDEDYDLIEEKIDIKEHQVNIDEDCLESVNTNYSGTDIDDKSTIKKIPVPNTIDNNTDNKTIDNDVHTNDSAAHIDDKNTLRKIQIPNIIDNNRDGSTIDNRIEVDYLNSVKCVFCGFSGSRRIPLHSFPKNPAKFLKWITALNVQNKSFEFYRYKRICGLHFAPESYSHPKSRRLNSNAIPLPLFSFQISTTASEDSDVKNEDSPVASTSEVVGPSYNSQAPLLAPTSLLFFNT